MQISSPNYMYQIPESCCKANVTEEICKTSRKLMIASLVNPTINTQVLKKKLFFILNIRKLNILFFFFVFQRVAWINWLKHFTKI